MEINAPGGPGVGFGVVLAKLTLYVTVVMWPQPRPVEHGLALMLKAILRG